MQISSSSSCCCSLQLLFWFLIAYVFLIVSSSVFLHIILLDVTKHNNNNNHNHNNKHHATTNRTNATTTTTNARFAAAARKTQHPQNDCIRYDERYRDASFLSYPQQPSQNNNNSSYDELVILRIGNQGYWSSDYLRSVLSVLHEASTNTTTRVVILHVLERSLRFVPPNLEPFVVPFSEKNLSAEFPVFETGRDSGDLVVASVLRNYPAAKRAWAFEDDCRLAGHWGEFLDLCSAEVDDDPDWQLIMWHSSYQNRAAFRVGDWLHNTRFYRGSWAKDIPVPLLGAFFMGFGLGRNLSTKVIEFARRGDTHIVHEVNLPTVARLAGIRTHEIAFPQAREWVCCRQGLAETIYVEWMRGLRCLPRFFLMHAVKLY